MIFQIKTITQLLIILFFDRYFFHQKSRAYVNYYNIRHPIEGGSLSDHTRVACNRSMTLMLSRNAKVSLNLEITMNISNNLGITICMMYILMIPFTPKMMINDIYKFIHL